MLYWQDDQGRRARQEFAAVIVNSKGQVSINPQTFADWLAGTARDEECSADRERAAALLKNGVAALEKRLERVSNDSIHPENIQLTGCGWVRE
jgi:hypothetical protein